MVRELIRFLQRVSPSKEMEDRPRQRKSAIGTTFISLESLVSLVHVDLLPSFARLLKINLHLSLFFCRQIRLERELKSLLWKIDYSEIVLGRSDLEYFGTQSEEDPPLSVRRRLIIVGISRVRLVRNKGQKEGQSKGRVRIWDVGDRSEEQSFD